MKKLALIGMALLTTVSMGMSYAEDQTGTIANTPAVVMREYSETHKGIDYVFKEDTKIKSPFSGYIEYVEEYNDNYYIVVTNGETGDSLAFVNVSKFHLDEGDIVSAGDVLGEVMGDSLHVSYFPNGFKDGHAVNPSKYLSKAHGLTFKGKE